jgi:tetratricopeptide (TPR) repeat protein
VTVPPQEVPPPRFLPSVDRLEEAMRSGRRAYDAGQLDQALRHFTEALRLKPEYDTAWILRGHTQRRLGQDEEAMRSFAQALRQNPESADAWLGLATALHGAGRLKEESEAYDKVLQIHPRLVEAWINKGAALHELKDYPGAIACYDKILALRPEHAAAWSNKGAALLRLEDFKAAGRCFAEALRFHPDFYDAIVNAVFLAQKEERHGETVMWADRAIAIREAAWLWYAKGLAHLGLLESTLALRSFERAAALDPGLREARAGIRKAQTLHEKVDLYRGVYECFGTHLAGDPGCAECEIVDRCREVSP